MGVSDKKMQKLVVKAWYAKDAPESRLKFSKYNDQFRKQDKKIYKELMGYIFVFGVRYDFTRGGTQKRLITIYN